MKQSTLYIYGSGGEEIRIPFTAPVRLSALFARNSIAVDMPCGGRQKCLKCKVKATGDLSVMDKREKALLTEQEQADNIRYACMTEALGNVQVSLLSTALYTENIVTGGYMPDFELNPWGTGYGVAVDIGTTTVAAYLYDLSDGTLLKTAAEKNPQSIFGADVISRLQKSIEGEQKGLAESIQGCLLRLMGELCDSTFITVEQVDSMVLTGNTAMLYLLCGKGVHSIATAPFEQDCYFGNFLSGQELDLPGHIRVYLPSCISAYVGADITTALLASQIFDNGRVMSDSPRLLVDIGTNGEMVLAANGVLWCCSTAAGPAFEGAGIYQGMPARTGAIHRVTQEDGRIASSVLGGGEAAGICGSGLLDAVAVMCQAGIVDETGVICKEGHPFVDYIKEVNGQPAFLLPGTPVMLTQQDIRAVQLAKSAICAGMQTLLKEAGYKPGDISELVIAGGFGSNINVRSAEKIGLIPAGFADKARSIGNAAGIGASMVLLSDDLRRQTEQIRSHARTVELSTNSFFMDAYIDGMMFPKG